jgi:hypothetical protein
MTICAVEPGKTLTAAACRVCKSSFWQRTTMHALCSPKCLVKEQAAKAKAERAERVKTRAQLDALRPRSHWLKLAQRAFNAYVRARDAHLPCISCGRMHVGSWDAGHYLTQGARPELRFNEDNCHRQCVPCNQHLHGNLVLYRIGLIARIGLARVEALEGPHPPAKWTSEELRALQRAYAAKARAA